VPQKPPDYHILKSISDSKLLKNLTFAEPLVDC
jgi:hypothetical protein